LVTRALAVEPRGPFNHFRRKSVHLAQDRLAHETAFRVVARSLSNPIIRSGEDYRHFNFNSYPAISEIFK